MEKPSALEELKLRVRNLTAERDALAVLAESYKGSVEVLSHAYATANVQLTQTLELSEALTSQYRDIARDRAESITHLLHGSRTAAGNTLKGLEGTAGHSPNAKLEAVIAKREQKLNRAVRNPSFSAARLLTGFSDGNFSQLHSRHEKNANYEVRLEYLAELDKEITRLMSSQAYLLRARLAAKVGKSMKSMRSHLGQSK